MERCPKCGGVSWRIGNEVEKEGILYQCMKCQHEFYVKKEE